MAVDIRTTQAGSLPRTPELLAANEARQFADDGLTLLSSPDFDALLTKAVIDIVDRQNKIGITIPGDGEFGKAMASPVDYSAWLAYAFQRVSGLELVQSEHHPSSYASEARPEGKVLPERHRRRRDWKRFADAYSDPTSGISVGSPATAIPVCTSPLSYTGGKAVGTDITNLKAGLSTAGVSDGFITAIAPGSASRIRNDYYSSQEEHIWAWADVLHQEYKAIVDAGLMVQIDDPALAENWDLFDPEPSVENYLATAAVGIEALNYALRGLPAEKIRLHLCWGSWHGPHSTDLELRHLIDAVLSINAGSYSFEAANARHEHEWRVWESVKLPDGKALVPGVVSHATNVVEHPELVADRIERFARIVGAENVIASTDCGLGGRVHPQIATAKLESLVAGADLATGRFAR